MFKWLKKVFKPIKKAFQSVQNVIVKAVTPAPEPAKPKPPAPPPPASTGSTGPSLLTDPVAYYDHVLNLITTSVLQPLWAWLSEKSPVVTDRIEKLLSDLNAFLNEYPPLRTSVKIMAIMGTLTGLVYGSTLLGYRLFDIVGKMDTMANLLCLECTPTPAPYPTITPIPTRTPTSAWTATSIPSKTPTQTPTLTLTPSPTSTNTLAPLWTATKKPGGNNNGGGDPAPTSSGGGG